GRFLARWRLVHTGLAFTEELRPKTLGIVPKWRERVKRQPAPSRLGCRARRGHGLRPLRVLLAQALGVLPGGGAEGVFNADRVQPRHLAQHLYGGRRGHVEQPRAHLQRGLLLASRVEHDVLAAGGGDRLQGLRYRGLLKLARDQEDARRFIALLAAPA